MTKYSLRARMMILILAPTLMIGLLLSTFFVVHRYNELQNQLTQAGASIIEPLAVASEYGMTFRERQPVQAPDQPPAPQSFGYCAQHHRV
jgi:two-component system sensor histidine kinase BarA